RGAAEGGGDRAGVEIVGTHHAHARLLFDVAVAIDAAREDELAAGIDLARSRALQVRSDLDDLAILDGDVALGLALGRYDAGVADDQIVIGHVLLRRLGETARSRQTPFQTRYHSIEFR